MLWKKVQLTLGLISSFFHAHQLQTLDFSNDPLVLICPIDHVLKNQTELKLIDTLNYPFVGLMQYHSLQQSIEAQAKKLRVAPFNIVYVYPILQPIAQVVANGVGIAISAQSEQPND